MHECPGEPLKEGLMVLFLKEYLHIVTRY